VLFPLASYPVPLPSEERLESLSQQYDLQSKTVIASYGFLMAHKGIIELVEALPALLESHPNTHLLLVNAIYSDGVSGEVLQKLEEAIERLGLAEHVTHVADFLSDEESLALLKLAKVVAFPYRSSDESSSAAVRMAISAGSTIAVTPVDIFSDIASVCYLLPGESPRDLAAGLSDLLEKLSEPAFVEEKRQAVEVLAREFDADELSERLLGMAQGYLRRLEVH
jgi:glycosyltransferase involved in cell wall biosynthesis